MSLFLTLGIKYSLGASRKKSTVAIISPPQLCFDVSEKGENFNVDLNIEAVQKPSAGALHSPVWRNLIS